MSAYEPPSEIDPIFNSLAFQSTNNDTLTTAEGDERYLARKNVATSIASATTFSAEVGATSFTSLNSGATTFHIDNLAGNNASLVIRNQRTDKDLIYRQYGTTNSHVFTTNTAGTTNLTMSNTENLLGSTNVLTRVDVTGTGTAIQAFKVRDKTTTNQVVITPNATVNFLNPMTGASDVQVLGGNNVTINTTNLVLATWSSTTSGVRLTPTTVNIGAGGTTNIAPTSGILFNSSAGNATMTGNLVMSSSLIGGLTQVNSINSGALGLIVQNLAANTGGLVVRNQNTTSDLVIDAVGGARSVLLQIGGVSQVSVASTTTSFAGDIVLRTTAPTNTAGYLGYTVKQNGTNTAAITTGVAYNNNATGLSITPGVYIFHILLYNSKLTAGSGDINEIQVGISTSAANFVGGDTTIIKGFQTYVSTASAQVVMGNASFTFSVPTTATYYFLQQASHTIGATNLIGTTTSYWEYTRVA